MVLKRVVRTKVENCKPDIKLLFAGLVFKVSNTLRQFFIENTLLLFKVNLLKGCFKIVLPYHFLYSLDLYKK